MGWDGRKANEVAPPAGEKFNSKRTITYTKNDEKNETRYKYGPAHLVPLEPPSPGGLALDPHHGRHARVGRVAPVPRREVVENQRLGPDLLGEGGGHNGGAVAVLDGLGLDVGVRLAL